MSDPAFRDLQKLQEAGVLAEDRRVKLVDRILMRNYQAAYKATVAEIARLYEKVGLVNPVDGVHIRKEDAIRYNQLANHLQNIADEMTILRKKGVKLTEESNAQAVQDGYYRTAYAYDQAVGVALGIRALPISAIRASIYSESSGMSFIKTWKKNNDAERARLSATITRGITNGYSYTKTARAVKTDFERGLKDALRVVRTEAGRAWSEGYLSAHDEAVDAGLNIRKRWSSTLDFRTRPEHGALDGTFADKDGLFWIGGKSAEAPRLFGDPAEDINCRCAAYDVIDDITPSVRRIRGEGIVPYKTFEGWAEPKGWIKERGWPRINSTASQRAKAEKAS